MTDIFPTSLADIAAERAAKGAVYLDETLPGWASRVNLADLNMASCYSCVLGQLYGSFHGAALFEDVADADDQDSRATPLGFDRETHSGPDYAELGDAWRAEILARRA